MPLANFTPIVTSGGTTTLDVDSTENLFFTGTGGTIVLPVVATLPYTGWAYFLDNGSSGVLQVNSSGGNFIAQLNPGASATFICILLTGTTDASWKSSYLKQSFGNLYVGTLFPLLPSVALYMDFSAGDNKLAWVKGDNSGEIVFDMGALSSLQVWDMPDASGAIVLDSATQTLTNKSIDASQLTGAITAARMPALTGDVTTSAGAVATTIAAGVVTFAKMATAAWSDDVTLAGNSSTVFPTQHAVLTFVNNSITGLKFKQDCRVASTANVTVSNPGTSTFDGVALSSGDRILLKSQTAGAENGPYLFNGSSSALTRTTDGDAAAELISATFPIREGTVNQDTWWTITNDTITLGTTVLVLSQTGGAGTYTVGTGLTLTGNSFSLTTAALPLAGGTLTGQLVTRAGATGAGTAPIKLVSGSLNTAAEAGALEFLTDAFYATITTGAVRKSIPLGPSAGPITFAGPTAARTVTLPDAAITVARIDAAQSFTGVQTFTSASGSDVNTIVAGNATNSVKIIHWQSQTTTWIDMPTTGPAGIGNGGVGSNAWIARANSTNQWFTGSAASDICYRNSTGQKIHIGIDNGSGNANPVVSIGATSFDLLQKVTKYNNVTTAGWGIPAVYASARSTAQTAAVASVATYTVGASDGSFLVSSNGLVTTSGLTYNFTVTVAYTDEGNTARTLTLSFSSLAGVFATAIVNTGGAVPYEGVPLHIRCKASTAITIASTGTFTSVTYNIEGLITQVS